MGNLFCLRSYKCILIQILVQIIQVIHISYLAYNYASEWEYSDKSQKAISSLCLDFLYNDGI